MISIIGQSKMLPIVEHTSYSDHLITPWVLDRNTLQFTLKGSLPYDSDLLKPQTNLLKYVLEQPYSRDMVCSMLKVPKTVTRMNSKFLLCLEWYPINLILFYLE